MLFVRPTSSLLVVKGRGPWRVHVTAGLSVRVVVRHQTPAYLLTNVNKKTHQQFHLDRRPRKHPSLSTAMVLFDEDPVTLISETTNQFHIAPDRDALTRVSGSLHTLQQARSIRLENHAHALKQLSRRLHHLQSQSNFEEERHDAGKHASEMLRMDTEKFRIAKGASDAEIEVERLEGELASLRSQWSVLEQEGVEGGRRGKAGDEDEIM